VNDCDIPRKQHKTKTTIHIGVNGLKYAGSIGHSDTEIDTTQYEVASGHIPVKKSLVSIVDWPRGYTFHI
jgi:hypothetical protein